MFDTLPALFTIIALYLLLERKFDWAAVSLIVASALKYYAIVLLIPLLVIAWQTSGRKELLRTLSFTVGIRRIISSTDTLWSSVGS